MILNQNTTFILKLIRNNNTVPVILADNKGRILQSKNLDPQQDTISFLTDEIKDEFSVYDPIIVQYLPNQKNYLYYKDSRFLLN